MSFREFKIIFENVTYMSLLLAVVCLIDLAHISALVCVGMAILFFILTVFFAMKEYGVL